MFQALKDYFSRPKTVADFHSRKTTRPLPPSGEVRNENEAPPKPPGAKKVRAKKANPVVSELTEKQKATAANEPYISILNVDIDPNNINNGSFEFDWNDKFLLNLIRAGYKLKDNDTDAMIVDRWFHTVCRNVVLEMYEQGQADPTNRDPNLDTRVITERPLGGGRTEIS